MTEIVYKGSGFTCPPSVIYDPNKYVALDILRKEAGVLNLRLQRSFRKTKSGHTYIHIIQTKRNKYPYWTFSLKVDSYGYIHRRSFKRKIDAICYKFIGILKYIVFVRKLTK